MRSGRYEARSGGKRFHHRILVTSILALTVLAGCTSTEAAGEDVDIPVPPRMPRLEWSACGGLYCIGEEDADRLLDYAENGLAGYRDEIGRASRIIAEVKEALIADEEEDDARQQ